MHWNSKQREVNERRVDLNLHEWRRGGVFIEWLKDINKLTSSGKKWRPCYVLPIEPMVQYHHSSRYSAEMTAPSDLYEIQLLHFERDDPFRRNAWNVARFTHSMPGPQIHPAAPNKVVFRLGATWDSRSSL